jgi:hypothetical protein
MTSFSKCPTTEEMIRFIKSPHLQQLLMGHISFCSACAKKITILSKTTHVDETPVNGIYVLPSEEEINIGFLVTIGVPEDYGMEFETPYPTVCRVIPLNYLNPFEEAGNSTKSNLPCEVIKANETSLGFPMAVEWWNNRWIYGNQLHGLVVPANLINAEVYKKIEKLADHVNKENEFDLKTDHGQFYAKRILKTTNVSQSWMQTISITHDILLN